MKFFALAMVLAVMATGVSVAQEKSAAKKVSEATAKATEPTYDLRYKFSPSEVVRTKVVHLVTIETKIQGTTETVKSRSVSTRKWEIDDVDAAGNITFVHSVEEVDMWQKSSGRQEVQFNSSSNEKPPAEYEHVQESVGVPLATLTINRYGQVLKRESKRPDFHISIADVTVPLPGKAVKVGYEWFMPDETKVRLEDKTVKVIKVQHRFTLEKVETGVATILAATEILTPITDPKIESQVVQKLQRGSIKFDIDAGRVISKQMDLDKTVIGFSGQQSVMTYLARLSEEQVTGEEATAAGKSSRRAAR